MARGLTPAPCVLPLDHRGSFDLVARMERGEIRDGRAVIRGRSRIAQRSMRATG